MNLSSPFIKRPVMTTLVTVGIIIFGLLAYDRIPISDLPSIDYPTISVTAANPGSDAETMAATVATPLEKQFMVMEGINQIRSTSYAGQTSITLSFDLDRSLDGASTDVSAAISRAAGDLPTSMPSSPSYTRVNPSASPVMFIAVSSNTMTMPDLYDFANTVIAQQISMIQGVSQVQTYGAKRALRIKVNPDKLNYLGLGLDQVGAAVQNANQNLPAGQVYDQMTSFTLQPLGQIETAEQCNNLIIAYNNHAPIRIKDIGMAYDSTDIEDFYISYWNDVQGFTPTVVLAINRQAGANTVALCETINNLIPKLNEQVPPAVRLFVIYDQSRNIKAAIWDVELTLIVAYILVLIVILLFLGKPMATLIPSLVLPIAMLGTCIIMYWLGYSVDILSTMAFTLVIGFLIDDALVVVENIVRHSEMNKSPMQAAFDGSKQISATVLSMTLSLAAVFIPLIFMPGIIGRMFHEFAIVIIISVLISGLLSLTLTPMLCSRFLQKKIKHNPFEKSAHAIFRVLLRIYEPCLEWCLRFKWVPIAGAVVAVIASAGLFFQLPQDFLPAGDIGVVQGMSLAPQSVSPPGMVTFQTQILQAMKENPHIESLIGAANFFLPNQGVMFAILKPANQRPPINQVIQELNQKLALIPGIQSYLRPMPEINLDVGTSQSRTSYNYLLSTIEEPEEFYRICDTLTQELAKLPQLQDVSNDIQNSHPTLLVNILRDRASTYGVTAEKIEQAFSLGYAQGQLALFSTPVDTYEIIMQIEDDYSLDPSSLDKIYLTAEFPGTSGSQLVPLSSVAEWKQSVGPLTVQHYNQFSSCTIYFNLKPGVALGTATQKIEEISAQILPANISHSFQGSAQAFQQTLISILILIAMAVVVIYLLLGILYESFLHPLTILSALPGASFGALLTVYIFGATLSLYAYVGVIVLIGLVLKNGIMLVEFATELIEQGESSHNAITQACKLRFRPIVMTTVAAGMGAVPIALGMGFGDSRRALGLVIVGGLIFSQLITFFFTPVVFLILENLKGGFFEKRKTHASE